ncbi:MAG: recombinase family protein [Pseudolabrys sp.]|jgi:DNA invertase Pin-like site-specific DNA recombinase
MPKHSGKWVSYLRVSTDKQGKSGLGLEAQRKAVADFLNGGRWQLLTEFVEVESGNRSDRPQLASALAACKKHKAKLVIAKLDRLARNVNFVSGLMETGVEFVAADMPFANKLTIHILAAVAEHEREAISARTKAALAAAKARGVKLGGPKLRLAQLNGATANKAEADRFAANTLPLIREAQKAGASSLRAIADILNARGVRTARGGKWAATQVRDIMLRTE